MMAEDFFKDFDILSPPKRIAVIGGEQIDVSFIPAGIAFNFIKFRQKYNPTDLKNLDSGNTSGFNSEMLTDMLEIIELICKRSSEKITKDWLLENVDINILMEFIQFIFAGFKKIEGEGDSDGKNSQSGSL